MVHNSSVVGSVVDENEHGRNEGADKRTHATTHSAFFICLYEKKKRGGGLNSLSAAIHHSDRSYHRDI